MAEHGMKDRRWHKRTKGVSHKLPEGHVIKPHPAFNKDRARVGRAYKPPVGKAVGIQAAAPTDTPTVVLDKPLPETGKKTTKKKKETNK